MWATPPIDGSDIVQRPDSITHEWGGRAEELRSVDRDDDVWVHHRHRPHCLHDTWFDVTGPCA